MYTIDLKNRQIIITNELKQAKVIKEFEKIDKKFLPNTQDTYECILVLLEVDVYDDNHEVIGKETKAFAQRVGNKNWLMTFDESEYNI